MCALISLLWGVGGYVLYLYCFVHGSRHCGESVFSLKPQIFVFVFQRLVGSQKNVMVNSYQFTFFYTGVIVTVQRWHVARH